MSAHPRQTYPPRNPRWPSPPVTDDSQLKQLTRAVEHLTGQVEHLRNAGARPPRRSSRQLVRVVGAVDEGQPTAVEPRKQEMLWNLVEGSSPDPSPSEKDLFYHLLLSYADVIAHSKSDLGRTSILKHHIVHVKRCFNGFRSFWKLQSVIHGVAFHGHVGGER